MTIYEKIQYLCDEKGIKLATLCKEANISKSTLSELKTGRTKTPSTQTLSKIANYFSVNKKYSLNIQKIEFLPNSVDLWLWNKEEVST